MTNQISPNENELRINEISLSILDHLHQNGGEFNNFSRDLQQAIILNMQYLHDNERRSLFIAAFFDFMNKYVNGMKKNDICVKEIEHTIDAIKVTMEMMFDKMKSDLNTVH